MTSNATTTLLGSTISSMRSPQLPRRLVRHRDVTMTAVHRLTPIDAHIEGSLPVDVYVWYQLAFRRAIAVGTARVSVFVSVTATSECSTSEWRESYVLSDP
jgi:hypothetical protein